MMMLGVITMGRPPGGEQIALNAAGIKWLETTSLILRQSGHF
jgi:hypothetical protein